MNTDFRPPSAGPHLFSETQLTGFQKQNKDVAAMKAEKGKAPGVRYRLMIGHVKKVLADIKRVVPDCSPTRIFIRPAVCSPENRARQEPVETR